MRDRNWWLNPSREATAMLGLLAPVEVPKLVRRLITCPNWACSVLTGTVRCPGDLQLGCGTCRRLKWNPEGWICKGVSSGAGCCGLLDWDLGTLLYLAWCLVFILPWKAKQPHVLCRTHAQSCCGGHSTLRLFIEHPQVAYMGVRTLLGKDNFELCGLGEVHLNLPQVGLRALTHRPVFSRML